MTVKEKEKIDQCKKDIRDIVILCGGVGVGYYFYKKGRKTGYKTGFAAGRKSVDMNKAFQKGWLLGKQAGCNRTLELIHGNAPDSWPHIVNAYMRNTSLRSCLHDMQNPKI